MKVVQFGVFWFLVPSYAIELGHHFECNLKLYGKGKDISEKGKRREKCHFGSLHTVVEKEGV